MTNAAQPARKAQCLNGFQIKTIALVLMAIDHIHEMFHHLGVPSWVDWFGRPVAAIFIFFIAEGFYYTRSKKRYMLTLLAGSVVMTVLSMVFGRLFPMDDVILMNNIFSTLFMITFYLALIDAIIANVRQKKPIGVILPFLGLFLPFVTALVPLLLMNNEILPDKAAVTIMLFVPNIFTVEGGQLLVLLGILFYYLRRWRLIQMALIAALAAVAYFSGSGAQWLMVTAIIPLAMYNGERGKGSKYFFYIFYPAHIYLYYVIAWALTTR